MALLRCSVFILVLVQTALSFSELLQASSSLGEGLGGEAASATRTRLFRRSPATTPTPSSTTQGKQRPRAPAHSAGGAPSAPDNSEPSLTCHAHCPRCPLCPTPAPAPAPVCPSPCAACPPTPKCPSTCAPCPTCPACKPRIPPGYEHHPNLGYYKLHLTPSTWMEAKDTCEREGAHLAVINSQAEADLMKQLLNQELLQPNDGKFIYLGFHDLYKDGKFMTVLGQTLSATGFTKWNPGQPDNAGNSEHCGSMYPSGGLNDLTCTRREIFVCEYPV